ncbi:MAG TPA: hypothetical protein VKS80_00590 [Trinickia sp.]|nr:hypothetical protein [Trinickia sp.]
MTDPTLDFRDAAAFYQQALDLARAYTPEWSDYWPPVMQDPSTQQDPVATAQAINQDPGLVLLNLFAQLAAYTASIENQVPYQRRQAFFQFLGMTLRPPLAAQAPLQFTLRAEQPAQLVPAQSAVLDVDAQDIRFQTNGDLLVVPATLCAAMTIIPAQDQYIDAMPVLGPAAANGTASQGAPVFVAGEQVDPAEEPLGHWFIMGDAELFKPDPALQEIVVTLHGKALYGEYFAQWFDGALRPLAAQVRPSIDGTRIDITIDQKLLAPPLTIDQLVRDIYAQEDPGASFTAPASAASDQASEYWLLVKPGPEARVLSSLARQLPVITGLQCTFRGDGIQAQQAAYDVVLVDLANGAYPFGQTPQVNDAFYIRSDSVFARTGALVTLTLELASVAVQFPVVLYWQFWDGSTWQSFNATLADVSQYQFVDTTQNLQCNNPKGPTIVQFLCPKIGATTVAGSEGLWIRVQVISGGYGAAGGFVTENVAITIDSLPMLTPEQKASVTAYLNDVEGVNFAYRFNEAHYYPPYIRSLSIGYSYSSKPARYWSYNAFELTRFLYSPYKPVNAILTGFYFAFATDGFGAQTLGSRLNLYFFLEQERVAPGGKLQWQYHDGTNWQPLAVDDGTYGLSRSGIVSFIVPAQMQPASLYSETAYWFRVENPHVDRTIRVHGLYPNTVMSSNLTTVEDEVLGSSNGQPAQTFTLTYTPVLPGMDLRVLEAPALDAAEQQDPAGAADASQVSQPWTQVESLSLSGPTDRVYTLDYQNGLVTFGDGYTGMIPPAGYNNIVAAHYNYTQGLAGNVAPNRLTLLRPGINNIEAVTNPAPALSGVSGDTPATIALTGPALVKANGYAVELGDLAALAAEACQDVAQAHAFETPERTIRIALIAQSKAPAPYVTPELLADVAAYVRARCLAPLAPRIDTVAAGYVTIDVSAQLSVTCAPDQLNAQREKLAAQLAAFFQPVFGGPAQGGWRFGQPVQAQAVNRFLRGLPQVAAVLGVALNGQQNGTIALAPDQLPVAGQMSLLLYLGAAP